MSSPKISIIIPIYNTGKYLYECLDSVITQTFTDIEIICINDGSTDNSYEILREYALKDSRIKIINKEKNEGTLLARKTGISEATGQYICFLDPDDKLSKPESVETIINLMEKENADILQFNMATFGDAADTIKSSVTRRLKNRQEKIEGALNIVRACINRQHSWSLANKIYKTEICKKASRQIRDIYLTIAEDAYTYLLVALYAKTFKSIITEPIYQYRLGSGSTTSNHAPISLFNNRMKTLGIVSHLEEFLSQEGILDKYRELLNTLKKQFEYQIVDCFYKLELKDMNPAYETFIQNCDENLLFEKYSRWKHIKYSLLGSLGYRKYKEKNERQKNFQLFRKNMNK